MPVRLSVLAILLSATFASPILAAVLLDQPSSAEATAAYRAIPAIAQGGALAQQETAQIESCKAAVGRPGVICAASVKKSPSSPAQDVTIHFARGPDSAWVATLQQTAP